jgi:hypothetical protein
VKLFKEPKSRFCWYDFTVQGHRYREIHFHAGQPLLAGSFNEPEFYAVRKAILLHWRSWSCYSAIIVAIKHASRIYRAWLSNLVCTSSGRTLFLLAQSGSIYILRTKFVGTSIASVMNYQYNAKVRH